MQKSGVRDLNGLGGWLILVGFGVIYSPFKDLSILYPIYKDFLGKSTYQLVTNSTSDSYIPFFGPLMITEIVIHTVFLVASFILIYLFFTKHYYFPKLYIAIMIASLVFILLDAWFVSLVLSVEHFFDHETSINFGKSVLISIVWIPYMLRSKRVSQTFTRNKKTSHKDIKSKTNTDEKEKVADKDLIDLSNSHDDSDFYDMNSAKQTNEKNHEEKNSHEINLDKKYEMALHEYESNQTNKAILAKSIVEANGDTAREKAIYIKLRVEHLSRD